MAHDVQFNAGDNQFTLATDAGDAVIDVEMEGSDAVFTHTVVPEAARGQGVGERLVAGALGIVREKGWKVVPQCPFVATYLREHEREQDLLADRATL